MGNLTEFAAIQVRDGFDDFGIGIHLEWSMHDDRLVDCFAAEQQREGRDSRAPALRTVVPETTSRFQRVRISSRAAASSRRSRRNRDTLDLPSFSRAMDCSSSLTSADAACNATPRFVRRTIFARVSVECFGTRAGANK